MIFLDLETSGLDPLKHGILSIGAVNTETKETFYLEPRLEEFKEIDPRALEVNGFTEEDVRDPSRISLGQALNEFMEWVQRCEIKTLGGQNTHFDAGFLKEAMGRHNIEWIFGHRYVDLFSTAINVYQRETIKIPIKDGRFDINLDVILESVGLEREGHHKALDDALLEAEAYNRLVKGKSLIEKFGEFDGQIRNIS